MENIAMQYGDRPFRKKAMENPHTTIDRGLLVFLMQRLCQLQDRRFTPLENRLAAIDAAQDYHSCT
jgi:hypothetical protein